MYKEIAANVKWKIITFSYKEDQILPSIRKLSTELQVSSTTIQKSYNILEKQGYIYTIPGKGKFVAQRSEYKKIPRKNIVKKDILNLLNEALYIGLTKEEIIKLLPVYEIEKSKKKQN